MNRESARRLLAAFFETPATRLLARLHFVPSTLTVLALPTAGAAAYLLGVGQLWGGGLVLLGSSAFDMLDGALARATGRVSRYGALLDSVVDRVSETIVLLGLLVFFLGESSTEGAVLVYLALSSSAMVSYLRSRAEGLGIECRVGVMTRPERVLVLSIGLVLGHWWLVAVLVALGTIAGLSIATAGQRLFHIRRELGRRE